jgi:hypothetical protein
MMMEAWNLRNLTIAQTPLLGDENTPLHTGPGGGFDGATPRHQVAFTLNPLATPRQQGTLGVSTTPLWTPLHDTLSINPGDQMTPREDLRNQQLQFISNKRALKAGFVSLPRPELVKAGLVKLIHHDSVEYPLPWTTRAGTSEFLYDQPDDDALEAAKIEMRVNVLKEKLMTDAEAYNELQLAAMES